MANIFIGVNQEAVTAGFFNVDEVTTGTASTASLDFELRIANPTTSGKTYKQDIIDALDVIRAYILDDRASATLIPGQPF